MSSSNPPFDFHFGQENADEIAQLKWDKPSPELIKSNNQYCLSTILKEYAGLPEEYPLRLTVEHSVHIGDWSSNVAKKTICDSILTASTLPPPVINRPPQTRAIPIGFGYLYAKALFPKFGLKPISEEERKGTIVFPFKVIRTAVLHFDHAAYAEQLKNLPEKFQPVYACLYYRNVPEIAHHYKDAGIPVLTAGHRFDPLFYHRFHDMCRRFRFAACNEFSTNLFLAVEDGCRFFFLDGPEIRRETTEKTDPGNRAGETFENNRKEARRLFNDPVEEITPEQKKFVNDFLGVHSIVSPRKLRRIILHEQKRIEKRPWWHGKRQLLKPPNISNFTWKEFPPSRGWEGLKKDGDTIIRWIEPVGDSKKPGNRAWVELRCPRKLRRSNSILKCIIHACTSEHLDVSINGNILENLKRTPDGESFSLEGIVYPESMADLPSKDTIRVEFHAWGKEISCSNPDAPLLSAAIRSISLKSQS